MEKIQTGLLKIDTKIHTFDNIQTIDGDIVPTLRDGILPIWYTQTYDFQFPIDSLTKCPDISYPLRISDLKTFTACMN